MSESGEYKLDAIKDTQTLERSERLNAEYSSGKVDAEHSTILIGESPERGAVISFHDVHYTVVTKEGCCSSCKDGVTKDIIKGISGVMKPGLNAIMGPTGSGKSSLLDILAGRKDPQGLNGLVLIDGEPAPDDFKRLSGYVVQNDVIMGTLSVRESLWFSANLRLPRRLTKEEKSARIENILRDLGLTECADTKVGTTLIRGISGGEKKRTAIAIELITEPAVIFLDEPTTGLDASTANAVMVLLKRLSRRGRTIICSIHQPRFSIYRLFDSLTLLCLGQMVFHGSCDQALPYFSEQGYHCEEHNNPADFFLDVINGDSSALSEVALFQDEEQRQPESVATAEKLSAAYANHPIYQNCEAELRVIYENYESSGVRVGRKGSVYATPFYYQFAVLSKRAAKNLLRNPIASVGNLMVNMIIGTIFGLLYFQVDDTTVGVQNRLGVLFFITTNLLFGSIGSLELFLQERDIFLKEHVSGYYRVISYFLAKMLADLIPVRTISPMIFCSITYWMVGLKKTVDAFFFFMLMVLLTGYTSVGIGLFYSATFGTFSVASLFLSMTFVFFIIFAGLLVNIDTILPWLGWLKYLSAARYGFAGMAINELRGSDYIACLIGTVSNCTYETVVTGESILESQLSIGTVDEPLTDWDMWQNASALVVISLGMFTLTYQLDAIGDTQTRENSERMSTKFKATVDVERSTISNGVREERGAVISFHDVHYTAVIKEGCCSSCKDGVPKEIIKGISGIMKPGLNAIMGPTGSGKSSLLDILAGRKDPQGLNGIVLVDGEPAPEDFKRLSGYVVQNDVIMGTLSVRESLWFSANLRLPRRLTKEEKSRRIEKLLRELGLTGCADTKVGTALIRGVSGGEKKRTAIAIELITEPSVLFLDEPTTGLDASTANAVMMLLKRLSQHGRTIICSIHQPRFSIYRLFDSLTLLCLGKMAYHGPCNQALPYFSEQGYHCEEHNNPADFFLDVINGDSSAISEIASYQEEAQDQPESAATSEKLSAVYTNHPIYKECAAELEVIYKKYQSSGVRVGRKGNAYVTPFYYQFAILSKRAARNILRNPIASVGNLMVNIIIAVFFGLLYYQLDNTTVGVQNRLGVLFFITTNLLFGSISSLELFVQERDIFLREHVSGYYRVISYFMAKMMADLIPVRTVAPIIFCSITYWMVGLKETAGAFFFFMLMVLFTGYASVAIGLFYSASFGTFAVATLFLTMTYVFSIIFAGLLVNIDTVFPWLSWIEYLSIARYGFAGMAINELRGSNYTRCLIGTVSDCRYWTFVSGDSILESQLSIGTEGEPLTDWDMWQNAFALGVIALGMFVLTYIQLCRMKTYT